MVTLALESHSIVQLGLTKLDNLSSSGIITQTQRGRFTIMSFGLLLNCFGYFNLVYTCHFKGRQKIFLCKKQFLFKDYRSLCNQNTYVFHLLGTFIQPLAAFSEPRVGLLDFLCRFPVVYTSYDKFYVIIKEWILLLLLKTKSKKKIQWEITQSHIKINRKKLFIYIIYKCMCFLFFLNFCSNNLLCERFQTWCFGNLSEQKSHEKKI